MVSSGGREEEGPVGEEGYPLPDLGPKEEIDFYLPQQSTVTVPEIILTG